MNNGDCKVNSILGMIQMLYPGEPVKGQTIIECSNKFFEKENVLPKLEYINENMIKVFRDSKEKDREYLFYILIGRMKQLYCNYDEYEKALSINKTSTSSILDNIIQGVYEIHEEDIPLIINEAYARLKVNNTIDEQIYKAIKKFYEDIVDKVSLFPGIVHVYQDGDESFCIGYTEENLVSVLMELCKILASNNETEVLEKVAFSTGQLIYDSYEYSLDSENVKTLYEKVVGKFTEIQNVCKDTHISVKKFIDFYIKAFDIMAINAQYDETVADKKNGEELKKCFLEFMNSLNNELLKKYWNNIKSLSYTFITFGYNVAEECKSFFLQAGIELINKNSTSNLKKKMIDELILQTRNIMELFNLGEYKYIAKIYDKENHDKIIKLTRLHFEIAYSLAQNDRNNEARSIYEKIIESGNAGSAVYNNLGVIYEKEEKDYIKALQYYEKSIELNPNDKISINNIERVKSTLKDLEEKPKKMKDIYFKKLKTWHRKILFAIYRLSDNDEITLNNLSEATKQSIDNIEKNLGFLIDIGMVSQNKSSFSLDSTIEEMVRDYIDPKLEREIIKVDNTKLYRPIFYHESEIFMYKALLELFPQHLVFPNMSLKTIFDIDKMKELLDSEELKYLYMAHVDFVIINTSSYFPVLAFEKDSSYNDTDYAKDRTEKKNLIFRTGGIPLIRLKFNSGIEYEKLKSDIRESTKSMILEYSEDNTYEVDFEKEFDVKRFGIVNCPIDLEIIKTDWEATVGKGIAQKSKVIDVENGKLLIEISMELKPIIEMSETVIKQKLFDKYDFLKEVEFMWY